MNQPSRPQRPDAIPRLDAAATTALKVHPELRRILEQRLAGWMFVYQPEKPQLTGACLWSDGWSDGITIAGENDAAAFRVDPFGRDRWKALGTLHEMLDALAALPNPVFSYDWPVLLRTVPLPGPRGGRCA
jgi:hypothetical protein